MCFKFCLLLRDTVFINFVSCQWMYNNLITHPWEAQPGQVCISFPADIFALGCLTFDVLCNSRYLLPQASNVAARMQGAATRAKALSVLRGCIEYRLKQKMSHDMQATAFIQACTAGVPSARCNMASILADCANQLR